MVSPESVSAVYSHGIHRMQQQDTDRLISAKFPRVEPTLLIFCAGLNVAILICRAYNRSTCLLLSKWVVIPTLTIQFLMTRIKKISLHCTTKSWFQNSLKVAFERGLSYWVPSLHSFLPGELSTHMYYILHSIQLIDS